jgi:NADP-dependent 3-hydroxy acid dehydrogenase YdfG
MGGVAMEGELSDPLARYAGALSNATALVTGAGSGIGRAIAVAFARAGADVSLLGRSAERLSQTASMVEAAGARSLAMPTDVADPAATEAAVAGTVESLGVPRIAVANAGVNAWADLGDLEPELLRAALTTNVEGVANVARAVAPAMRDAGGGKLLVVASDNGRRPESGGSGYVASKFAAVGLSLSLSQELLPDGIGVHVIEPGCVDTEWYPPEEDAPRDRMLRPDDVALVALFLATMPSGVVLDEVMMQPRALMLQPWD